MRVVAVPFVVMRNMITDTVSYDPDVAQHLWPHKHRRTYTARVHVYMYVRSFHIAVLNTWHGDEFYGSARVKYCSVKAN